MIQIKAMKIFKEIKVHYNFIQGILYLKSLNIYFLIKKKVQ